MEARRAAFRAHPGPSYGPRCVENCTRPGHRRPRHDQDPRSGAQTTRTAPPRGRSSSAEGPHGAWWSASSGVAPRWTRLRRRVGRARPVAARPGPTIGSPAHPRPDVRRRAPDPTSGAPALRPAVASTPAEGSPVLHDRRTMVGTPRPSSVAGPPADRRTVPALPHPDERWPSPADRRAVGGPPADWRTVPACPQLDERSPAHPGLANGRRHPLARAAPASSAAIIRNDDGARSHAGRAPVGGAGWVRRTSPGARGGAERRRRAG